MAIPKSGRRLDEAPPAFQFYPGDFLCSEKVALMDLAERGAYITLLCHAWREGSIPSDIRGLARILHIAECEMATLWASHNQCWQDRGDGRLVNPRLERERQLQVLRREKAAENGANGALKRWGGHSDPNGVAIATPIAIDSTPSPSPSPKKDIPGSPPAAARVEPKKNGPWKPRHEDTARLAEYFDKYLRQYKPDVRFDASAITTLKDVELLLTADGRAATDVAKRIQFLFGGLYKPSATFDWRRYILSARKLREKYDQIDIEFRRFMAESEAAA